ncbi:hypothetical protein AGMMS49940_20770 [Spirochaetia bacterium]|nr:hypothetical protein AGMMS49940_20770 [Spirochaetia bacterium]
MRLKWRSIPGIVIIAAVLGLAGLYRLRAPVVLVVADEFTGLYGKRRSLVKQAEISLKLFRRVRLAPIADGASADVVAFAAVEAAVGPYAVLFPSIYQQGARHYAEQAPGIPVAVLGFPPGAGAGGLVFIETDRKTDFYRAGCCAAIFARAGGGGVLFFTGDAGNGDARQAFSKGLMDQGFEDPPLFVDRGENYTPSEGISCVVMAAPAQAYLDNNPAIPTILFSWMDPGITPREIKLIVDDSPWAQAAAAVKLLHPAQSSGLTPIPSEILIPRGRIGDEALRREIKKAVERKYID